MLRSAARRPLGMRYARQGACLKAECCWGVHYGRSGRRRRGMRCGGCSASSLLRLLHSLHLLRWLLQHLLDPLFQHAYGGGSASGSIGKSAGEA